MFDSYDAEYVAMANELILNLNANKINMKQMAQKGYLQRLILGVGKEK